MGSLDIYLSFSADFKFESKIYKANQFVLSPQLETDHVPIPNLEFGLFTNSYPKNADLPFKTESLAFTRLFREMVS